MKKFFALIFTISFIACNKKLELVPNSRLTIPSTAKDLEGLLDNTNSVMNYTTSLPQLSADEYIIPSIVDFNALRNETARSTYIWDKDIFRGQKQIADWVIPYRAIFYANSVLDILKKQQSDIDEEKKNIKGWALFIRAYTFYSLVCTYSKAYNDATASVDLGVPLKLTANIDEIAQRSTLQDTYNQIIHDALQASEFLQTNIIADKKNKPSKVAGYALLARVYLSMRKYVEAENYAQKALDLYSSLQDYSKLSVTNSSSFNFNSLETIYYSRQITTLYTEATFLSSVRYALNPTFLALYKANDLRLKIYFSVNSIGNYNYKAINGLGAPFTGLASDELYLIKAECLARRGLTNDAMHYLNSLVVTRMVPGTFSPFSADSANEALELVLNERKIALIWRGLRWVDIKRLNLEGKNISLSRTLNNEVYSLEPNSPKFVMPIPDDEIALSGLTQNPR